MKYKIWLVYFSPKTKAELCNFGTFFCFFLLSAQFFLQRTFSDFHRSVFFSQIYRIGTGRLDFPGGSSRRFVKFPSWPTVVGEKGVIRPPSLLIEKSGKTLVAWFEVDHGSKKRWRKSLPKNSKFWGKQFVRIIFLRVDVRRKKILTWRNMVLNLLSIKPEEAFRRKPQNI